MNENMSENTRALGFLPPLGWNSWNTFTWDINESLIFEIADCMVKDGYKDAGYEYLVIDDCWSLKERNENGHLVADPKKFPHGMKAVADYIHDKGLKFGMYSCAGTHTCAGYPGSFEHEFEDAKQFADFGVDYLKYDFCFKPRHMSGELLYKRMNLALRNCGRPILFSACNWGVQDPAKWMRSRGANSYRSTGDIFDVPCAILLDTNGNKVMDIQESDFSQLFAAGYKFPEIFKVKAADGVTDLYGVMYKPFNFDSTKVYPIVDYVYPGPQVEGVYYPFTRMSPRTDRLAQAGFIVISVGQRGGHPSRSKWYHNYGYGNMRDYPLADHKYAIEQLAQRHHFIDIDKVGIHGHSGGGFMSTAAMCQYPDFFKVAVSCAGNHDNNIYNRWWSETHHGVKEVVSEKGDTTFVYKIATNPEIAKQLKGNLLLIHGDIDNNVHPGNTLRVVDALIRAGKRFDMLILPQQRHGFGDMNEYFYWKLVDYFSEHLKGRSEKSVDIPKR